MTSSYDADFETDHSRDMAWGNEEEGAALNLRKRDGFVATLDRIERMGYGASKILDVGCSFGGILTEASKRGFDCAGTDIVPEAVDYVRRQGGRGQGCAPLLDRTRRPPPTGRTGKGQTRRCCFSGCTSSVGAR